MRVVVVVVCPYLPPKIFFGVESSGPRPDFSSGWDPADLDQIFLLSSLI